MAALPTTAALAMRPSNVPRQSPCVSVQRLATGRRFFIVNEAPKATPPSDFGKKALALGAAALALTSGCAIAGSEPGIVQSRDHWEKAAKRGPLDMSFNKESPGPLPQSVKDDPTHEFLSGKFGKSTVQGFRGHSSDAARRAAEQLDVEEVLRSITPPTTKFRLAMPDKT